jgi:hypothetical protein
MYEVREIPTSELFAKSEIAAGWGFPFGCSLVGIM